MKIKAHSYDISVVDNAVNRDGDNHVEIQLKNVKMIYNDPRRFGFCRYIKNEQ